MIWSLVYNDKEQVKYNWTSNIYWKNTFHQGLMASRRKWPAFAITLAISGNCELY